MPRPVLPDNLQAEMRVALAARRLLRAKADEVARYLGPALQGAVDGIHDLRIAVKRVREVLRLFRRFIGKRRRKRLTASAQELNDALGRVRELDVLLADLDGLIAADATIAPALEELREEWAQQRGQRLAELRALCERLDGGEDFLDEIRRAARAAARSRDRRADLPLDRFAYAAITRRVEQAMAAWEQARGSDDPHLLHLFRIAVKKLKYTMEPFAPIFPALEAAYQVTAQVQESLGRAHDCDVLGAALQEYFGRSGLAGSAAADQVLAMLSDQRAQLYQAARADIQQLDGAVWQRQLLDAID